MPQAIVRQSWLLGNADPRGFDQLLPFMISPRALIPSSVLNGTYFLHAHRGCGTLICKRKASTPSPEHLQVWVIDAASDLHGANAQSRPEKTRLLKAHPPDQTLSFRITAHDRDPLLLLSLPLASSSRPQASSPPWGARTWPFLREIYTRAPGPERELFPSMDD